MTGSSLLAYLVKVLAGFRHDARLSMEWDEIIEDDEDKDLYPKIPAAQVPPKNGSMTARPYRLGCQAATLW